MRPSTVPNPDAARALEAAGRAQAQATTLLRQQFHMAIHDLRNPLTALHVQIEMLQRADLDPDRRDHAGRLARRSLRRMDALLSDLLDLARLQEGRLELQREAVDLARLAAGTVELCEGIAEQRGVSLDLQVQGPVTAHVDPAGVERVIMNLVMNALKFTPTDGRVSVEVRGENGNAVVVVRDTGVGFTPSQAKTIFEAFTQGSSGLARGGAGLGLYICKAIVEEHGGRIWADSDGAGQGATFVVELPVA